MNKIGSDSTQAQGSIMSNQVLNTYKRKRMPYQIIKNVETLCRLCLKCNEVMIPIFNEHDDESDIFYNLPKRILTSIGIELKEDDELPQNICINCNQEIYRIMTYKKSCEVSQRKLKQHLVAQALEEGQRKALNNVQATATLQQTSEVIQPVSSAVCEEIVTVVGQEPECEVVVNKEERVREKEDIAAMITSKLIESKIVLMDNEGFTLSEDCIHLSNIDFEIMTRDNQFVNYELVEESDENVKDVKQTKLVMKLPIDQKPETHTVTKKPNCDKGYRCLKCDRTFASRSSLNRHTRIHTGARPYVCATCDRSFSQNEVLRRHELVHTEERPFKCSKCDKSFTQLNALSVHQRSHEPPQARTLRLHPCKQCHKVFLYASGVTRHVMVHHNGRLYGCTVAGCTQKFTDKSSMRRHIGLKHSTDCDVAPS